VLNYLNKKLSSELFVSHSLTTFVLGGNGRKELHVNFHSASPVPLPFQPSSIAENPLHSREGDIHEEGY